MARGNTLFSIDGGSSDVLFDAGSMISGAGVLVSHMNTTGGNVSFVNSTIQEWQVAGEPPVGPRPGEDEVVVNVGSNGVVGILKRTGKMQADSFTRSQVNHR